MTTPATTATAAPAKRPLRALTIYNPWAALIASGVKRIENRTWTPDRAGLRVGDYLAIHAGVFKPGREGTEGEWGAALELAERAGIVADVPFLAAFQKVVDVPRAERGRFYAGRCKDHIQKAVPYGAIVAVAVLVDVVREAPVVDGRPDPWFVNRPGNVGWVLDDVVALDPIACKGAQGVWSLTEEVLAEIRAQYKARTAASSAAPAAAT